MILVVFFCSFYIYFVLHVYAANNNNNDDGDGWTPLVHRSKYDRPRIVTLGLRHFGSSSTTIHDPYYLVDLPNNNSVVENWNGAVLFELPANRSASAMIAGDLLSTATTNNSSVVVVPSPPSTVAAQDEKICLPMAKWMKASYPNCNSVHEIDVQLGVSSITYDDEEDVKFLGQGWFRDTWKYVNDVSDGSPPVVLKTLRIEREFLDEYFDLHRRDAVAMERLTFSPYVINVHGYCGQSAINELAQGIMGGKITNLEQLDRRLRGKEEDPQALLLKLQLATKVSLGMAHVHNIHVSDNSGGRSKSVQTLLYEHTDPNSTHSTTGFGRSVPTMAHYDINPRNIAIMSNGSPKLNDFNIAEFLTYDPETNEPCGFRSRLHEPWWRAPEEMDMSHQTMVDEKVDIYALGEVLFHILTTHGPRGKMIKDRMEEVRAIVQKGIRPDMWEPYVSGGTDGTLTKNPIVRAFMRAMDLCFESDPMKRGTSIQVARVLHKALVKETAARKSKVQEEATRETKMSKEYGRNQDEIERS